MNILDMDSINTRILTPLLIRPYLLQRGSNQMISPDVNPIIMSK